MFKELELWQFIASHLKGDERVMLLVVAESSGSSPGRAGYKMAVAADGELVGSIGGGVMEVKLVELAKVKSKKVKGKNKIGAIEQIHRKGVTNSSGMICSGRQTVVFRPLSSKNAKTVDAIIDALQNQTAAILILSPTQFSVWPPEGGVRYNDFQFEKLGKAKFMYREKLGPKNNLYIVGGGHCALALSGLMSKIDFRISIFDDRPELNTIEKNRFADEITIIESYEQIGELISADSNVYVVVMTLGYASDDKVIRALLDKDFKYFGVLGSKAKMKTLFSSLAKDNVSMEKLARIRTPVGLPINSRTPDEIAVSIAAEIISVKNG